ncbi:hypothetical protein [Microvirus sp.]|nr:hypothetical protein [Microvirus sp.]
MKRVNVPTKSAIRTTDAYECDRLELKLRRLIESKEPIDENVTVPLVYTERKEGVLPAYDIRTDRFDLAIMAMDAANKMRDAKRWQGTDAPDEIKKPADKKGTEEKQADA